ncbi:MAG: DegT/DnrJ/EryC1/StrS aminotransferase family protein [Sulfurospirillaceae bacterium]|nr:DegT/DnrJ/EryC1/StrS aminotransferase family protein [Sulfurospirillaceae bacterium]MCK9545993.1 DegT/DnrJ/EryC1/StrS aminotransferase family protein [Sulfurospirillaceae bacterium]MDY0237471.1 DegT/DnrJ/EryC1/StrS aminotransferase family protein [Campylobacterales bacterium]NLM98887.1 DegT/DnrJ/EryC1/StrS aminotransferase family protein [Campylobacteraceae bacterium]
MREIPFYKPSIDAKEKQLVNEVLELKKPKMVKSLEEKMREFTGSSYAVSTYNGTAAMHLAMCAMDLKRGDRLLCSVNSFPSVAEVIRHFDAEPIFVDIDKDDFNICPQALEKTLKIHNHKKLKGIFVSHVAGQSAKMDEIYKLAKSYDIAVIDDATEALGATFEGEKIGSLNSTISCFRFSPQTRNPIASGGIMVTEDEELAKRAELLRNHGIISEGWDSFGNLGYVYDVVDIGVKYDMNELGAAYSLAQLSKTDEFIKRRQEIAKIYDKELDGCPHISTPVKKRDHIYTQYIIKIDKNRDGFARELKDKGVFTGLHYVPLHLLSYYKQKYNLRVNDFPIALQNYQQILSLPIYSALTNDEVHYICKQVKEVASTRV